MPARSWSRWGRRARGGLRPHLRCLRKVEEEVARGVRLAYKPEAVLDGRHQPLEPREPAARLHQDDRARDAPSALATLATLAALAAGAIVAEDERDQVAVGEARVARHLARIEVRRVGRRVVGAAVAQAPTIAAPDLLHHPLEPLLDGNRRAHGREAALASAIKAVVVPAAPNRRAGAIHRMMGPPPATTLAAVVVRATTATERRAAATAAVPIAPIVIAEVVPVVPHVGLGARCVRQGRAMAGDGATS